MVDGEKASVWREWGSHPKSFVPPHCASPCPLGNVPMVTFGCTSPFKFFSHVTSSVCLLSFLSAASFVWRFSFPSYEWSKLIPTSGLMHLPGSPFSETFAWGASHHSRLRCHPSEGPCSLAALLPASSYPSLKFLADTLSSHLPVTSCGAGPCLPSPQLTLGPQAWHAAGPQGTCVQGVRSGTDLGFPQACPACCEVSAVKQGSHL